MSNFAVGLMCSYHGVKLNGSTNINDFQIANRKWKWRICYTNFKPIQYIYWSAVEFLWNDFTIPIDLVRLVVWLDFLKVSLDSMLKVKFLLSHRKTSNNVCHRLLARFFGSSDVSLDFSNCRNTLNNSQKDDDDEEEKRDVKHYSVNFIIVTVRFSDFITDTTTGPYAFIQMKDETLKEKIK